MLCLGVEVQTIDTTNTKEPRVTFGEEPAPSPVMVGGGLQGPG